MFQDLRKYFDEVYFVAPPEEDQQKLEKAMHELKSAVGQIAYDQQNGGVRVPKRILQDMSWTKSAQKYVDVYQELAA